MRYSTENNEEKIPEIDNRGHISIPIESTQTRRQRQLLWAKKLGYADIWEKL